MKLLTPKTRISMGLVGIMACLVMLAFLLNVIPDRGRAVREGRGALAESIGIYAATLVNVATPRRLAADFALLVERNEDLLSIALRCENGEVLVATGDHVDHWKQMAGEFSKASQIQLPLWAGDQEWGRLELRFNPVAADGRWPGPLKNPLVRLILFMALIGFAVFYFYLGKVLRQLDPSKAIPARVRSALDTMAEGLLIIDRKEQIVLANEAFATIVGKTPDQLLGYRAGELPWTDQAGEKIPSSQRPWVQALVQGKVLKDDNVRLQLPGGEHRTLKTNCSPVLGEGGKHAGVLVSFDDITALEKKEVELHKSKMAAEEANRAKSSFLANMSHEIRSPMNAILGFTEILKRGYVKNEKESLRYLNTIHSSGKNLLELINDILDLSKVESGRLEIEKAVVEPYSIIYEVLRMMDVKAKEKGLSLDFIAEGDLPKEIRTDPVRLRQIVFNLVGNAIKFTDSGKVTVTCRYRTSGSLLAVDVTDSGIGISKEALRNIFDPFVQADSSITRRFGGTGLGLAISRKFALAMGGDLTAASAPGKGSTFSVALPTGDLGETVFLQPGEVEEIQQEIHGGSRVRWQFPPSRVLVVDDGEENRELVKLLLCEAGLSVDEAVNGREGVEKALEEDYSVIIMDVQMPVMDGFTAAGHMRKSRLTAPVIALTANAMKGFKEKCLKAGYSDYLSKPINIDQFMETMSRLLGGRRVAEEALPEPVPGGMEDGPPADAADVDARPIVSRLPGNHEKFRKIIVRFVEKLGVQMAALEGAATREDLVEVANLAHWLKGAGGTVGFDVFTQPAAELETAAKLGDTARIRAGVATLRALAARVTVPGTTPGPAAPGPPPVDSHASSPVPAADAGKPVVSRLAENPRLQPTILKFIEKLDEKLVQMQAALDAEDMAELGNLAHWLKGAGGTVGYDDFTQPAHDLERCASARRIEPAARMLEQVKSLARAVVPPVISD